MSSNLSTQKYNQFKHIYDKLVYRSTHKKAIYFCPQATFTIDTHVYKPNNLQKFLKQLSKQVICKQ